MIHERTRLAAQIILDGDWPLRAPLNSWLRPASRGLRVFGAPHARRGLP